MDYRALLVKYVEWIRECEGVSFIDSGEAFVEPHSHFTPEGWAELQRIDNEIDARQERERAERLAKRTP